MTLERITALLRRAGLDPDGYGNERLVDANLLDFLPVQELGREEINPDTWTAAVYSGVRKNQLTVGQEPAIVPGVQKPQTGGDVMKEQALRWRVMVGLGTDAEGDPMDASWARNAVLSIAQAWEAFSVTDGTGSWRGKQEPSLTLEYIGAEWERDMVTSVARTIVRHLNQEEVWISEEPIALSRIVQ